MGRFRVRDSAGTALESDAVARIRYSVARSDGCWLTFEWSGRVRPSGAISVAAAAALFGSVLAPVFVPIAVISLTSLRTVVFARGARPRIVQNKHPMICASKQARPAERLGTAIQRFDRRLCLAIGRQSAQRIVATHTRHHDIALLHSWNTGHDGSRYGGQNACRCPYETVRSFSVPAGEAHGSGRRFAPLSVV
jgi:hypothetical protein